MKSVQAECAKLIRKELKEAFPKTRFSVRSTSASMMTAVDIDWHDGPTSAEVNKIVGKYEYGSFNPMEDMYEMTNTRDDIPQVKFVQVHRKMTDAMYNQIAESIEKEFNIDRNDEAQCDALFLFGFEDQVYREFREVSLPGLASENWS